MKPTAEHASSTFRVLTKPTGAICNLDCKYCFRRSVELAKGYQRPGQSVQYTIQTNGTLLDDDRSCSSGRTRSSSG